MMLYTKILILLLDLVRSSNFYDYLSIGIENPLGGLGC
jgi:hypothetical protein